MRICFVAPRFPFPITKGDTLRAHHQIRELSRHHSIHLIAASEEEPSPAALAEMGQFCTGIEVVKISRIRSYATVAALGLGSRLPLQVLYFLSPALRDAVEQASRREHFDVIHGMTIRVAPAVCAATNVPVVVDFVDSYAANILSRRKLVGPVARRLYDMEFARVVRYERDVARQASASIVIAETDREAIGESSAVVIPNGVDTAALSYFAGVRDPGTIIFTGNMGYEPNIDAVTWFAGECWPALRTAFPELRFLIVGARPSAAVTALGRLPGIEVTGRVESMTPYLHRATVAVCPIRCGSGMQNKVLEAMAAGVPVVTTAFANRSIGSVAGREVQVGTEPAEIIEAVTLLLSDEALRRRQAKAARLFVESELTWTKHAGSLVQTYTRAIETFEAGAACARRIDRGRSTKRGADQRPVKSHIRQETP
jgi:sugar transferase (PEP-CTERM/EpsH1 system associated)